MFRRSHTTELGCIAGVDLSEIGAGKEGWLVDNPNILVSLDTHSLALANKSLILVLNWSSDPENISGVVKIRPDLSPIEAEYISAVEWLAFHDEDIRVLAVGTSCGYLLFYSVHGRLIRRQIVNSAKILKIRLQGSIQDPIQNSPSEEVCIVMPGVIARFDGLDIKNLVQKQSFQEKSSQFWNEDFNDNEDSNDDITGIPYQIWDISKYGPCADAAIAGVMPPPLMEIQSSQQYYRAVAIGDDAVISAYRLSVDKRRSLVGAILSKVVPATFSTIASFSKLIWRSEPKQTKRPEAKAQSFARAYALTCLKDHPRKGEKLTLSPSGTLAAITDSLGRILLLDTQALVVVRLWKGYREATCLFVEMLVNKNSARPAHSEYSKSDYCLCLAIHAPRKGIVEVWQMRAGPRLLTVPCPKGSKILQPTRRFSSESSSSSSSSTYHPLEVFFVNGDSCQLSVLNRFLH